MEHSSFSFRNGGSIGNYDSDALYKIVLTAKTKNADSKIKQKRETRIDEIKLYIGLFIICFPKWWLQRGLVPQFVVQLTSDSDHQKSKSLSTQINREDFQLGDRNNSSLKLRYSGNKPSTHHSTAIKITKIRLQASNVQWKKKLASIHPKL